MKVSWGGCVGVRGRDDVGAGVGGRGGVGAGVGVRGGRVGAGVGVVVDVLVSGVVVDVLVLGSGVVVDVLVSGVVVDVLVPVSGVVVWPWRSWWSVTEAGGQTRSAWWTLVRQVCSMHVSLHGSREGCDCPRACLLGAGTGR